MQNNYTMKTTEALQAAQDRATLDNHSQLTTTHMLDALVHQAG